MEKLNTYLSGGKAALGILTVLAGVVVFAVRAGDNAQKAVSKAEANTEKLYSLEKAVILVKDNLEGLKLEQGSAKQERKELKEEQTIIRESQIRTEAHSQYQTELLVRMNKNLEKKP